MCQKCSSQEQKDKCCNDKAFIPVYGPKGDTGAQGPPGPTVGTIIPYSSGKRFKIPNDSNTVNVVATLGFGSYQLFNSIDDIFSQAEEAFVMPRDGKIKTLKLLTYFDPKQLDNIIDLFGGGVKLWKSTNGVNYELITQAIGLDPTSRSYLSSSITLNPPIEISEGTHVLLSVEFGIQVANGTTSDIEFGFRGGLNIE